MKLAMFCAALLAATPAFAFSSTRCSQNPITGTVTCTTTGGGTFSTTRCTQNPITGSINCSSY